MIDQLHGTITDIKEKHVTLSLAGGISFALYAPKPEQYVVGSQHTFHTYLHWHQENGPSLFGFPTQLDRRVFLLIIDCPKIGPSIGLSILSQLSAGQFLELVTTGNIDGLSALHGIGSKKAEQLIVELKQKVQKLLKAGDIEVEQTQGVVVWQQLHEVLTSLNYSRPEITRATNHLTATFGNQDQPFDKMLRSALAFLSQHQG
ncbi:hypothetical protein EBZ39_05620 [bacterium]|nr:hypothetical protein [bacterium]